MTRLPVLLIVLSSLLTVSTAPALSQDWRGQGRAHGVVLDDDGNPLAGAEVRLVPVETMGVEPEPGVLEGGVGPERMTGLHPLALGERDQRQDALGIEGSVFYNAVGLQPR